MAVSSEDASLCIYNVFLTRIVALMFLKCAAFKTIILITWIENFRKTKQIPVSVV